VYAKDAIVAASAVQHHHQRSAISHWPSVIPLSQRARYPPSAMLARDRTATGVDFLSSMEQIRNVRW
jgi:hypothetical protein